MLDYCTAESQEFFKYEVYMLKFQIVRIFLQDTKVPADKWLFQTKAYAHLVFMNRPSEC